MTNAQINNKRLVLRAGWGHVRSQSATESRYLVRRTSLWTTLWAKQMVPKFVFWNPENWKWHQNKQVEATSAPGPYKTVSWGRLDKTWTNQSKITSKIMLFTEAWNRWKCRTVIGLILSFYLHTCLTNQSQNGSPPHHLDTSRLSKGDPNSRC